MTGTRWPCQCLDLALESRATARRKRPPAATGGPMEGGKTVIVTIIGILISLPGSIVAVVTVYDRLRKRGRH